MLHKIMLMIARLGPQPVNWEKIEAYNERKKQEAMLLEFYWRGSWYKMKEERQ